MSIHIASNESLSSEKPVNAPVNILAREAGLYCRAALLPGGWAQGVRIAHANGHITAVESGVAAQPGDELVSVALPGVPNVHSHAFQRGMAGLTERRGSPAGAGNVGGSTGEVDSFWSWRELMYRFVERLTPEDLESIAALAYAEMLEAGFTRVCEFHYVHHDAGGKPFSDVAEMGGRIAAAAAGTGIALTLLPVFYAHGGFGGTPPSIHQARFVNDVEQYGRLVEASRRAVASLDDAVVGIAPHSLRAVTPHELRSILPVAAGGPVHIHIAEQVREVRECEAALGARPVQWLLAEMPVDARWCLVHATHVTHAEVTALAASGAVAGLCPITEANLGDGVFPAAAYQANGGAYAIGSDSNVLISLSEELRLLEYGQRLRDGARNVMAGAPGKSTGRVLFDNVVRGGAQAAGLTLGAAAASAVRAIGESDVAMRGVPTAPAGSAILSVPTGLSVGAPADIVSLVDDVAFTGRGDDAILDTLIFASSRGLVDCVWRAGRKVVAGGAHRSRAAIAARFRATVQRLVAA